MTVRFLVDAQLPPALARHIAALGHDADHVADVGLVAASDQEIWQHAEASGAVIITKDEDFVTMRALRAHGPAIVWIRVGNTRKQALLSCTSAAWPAIIKALMRNEQVIEMAEE